ncbi:MAG: hypothetical protein LBL33_01790 [Tannerella sp.]|jgi:hypothetical protein|nr:hypothetical protein [Tannerella sp.]
MHVERVAAHPLPNLPDAADRAGNPVSGEFDQDVPEVPPLCHYAESHRRNGIVQGTEMDVAGYRLDSSGAISGEFLADDAFVKFVFPQESFINHHPGDKRINVFRLASGEDVDVEEVEKAVVHRPEVKADLPAFKRTSPIHPDAPGQEAGQAEIADARVAKQLLAERESFVAQPGGGISMIDLYCLEAKEYHDGRITYNRTKTENRRRDSALISIKVEPEALALIEKYKDPKGGRLFRFYTQYAEHKTFLSNIRISHPPVGLTWICQRITRAIAGRQ